ncbi:unnamed protein product, partial [Protopolystoma xenopodis]
SHYNKPCRKAVEEISVTELSASEIPEPVPQDSILDTFTTQQNPLPLLKSMDPPDPPVDRLALLRSLREPVAAKVKYKTALYERAKRRLEDCLTVGNKVS